MPSCSSAPNAGGSRPNAATTIAASDIAMPASALCTAIRRARRAISIASARRSSRSVVSTTSAASEEAVAPRAPIATPTVAAASAGASLRPSPTITVTARCPSARTPATLLAGVCSARTSSSPRTFPTSRAGSGRSPVSITSRWIPAARSRRRVRLASARSGSLSRTAPTGSPSASTHTSAQPSSPARLTRRARPRGVGCRVPFAHPHPDAVDRGGDAAARLLLDLARQRQRQPAPARLGDHRLGEHVRGQLVGRGGQPEHLGGRAARRGGHFGHRGAPGGEGAGLVQHQRLGPAEVLQRAAAAHDHPAPRGARQPGDDRHRRGQQQRTRRGDHQHGHRAFGRPARPPRQPGQGERQRQEPGGEPVGQPDHRRALRARLADQRDDPGVGALRGRHRAAHLDRAARVQRAAAHRLPDRALDQLGLAGQRRLVQHRRTRLDQPVHRQHLARADDHEIPDGDLVDRHLGDDVADPPARGARRPFQQRPQIPRGAPLRGGVQRPAGRQHHRDQRTRQVLAHRQRAEQGEDGDQVDAERPPQQRRHHPARRRDDRGDGRRSPQRVGPPARPGQPRHAACRQQRHRRHEQRGLEPPPRQSTSPPNRDRRPDEASPLDTDLSSVAIGPVPTVTPHPPNHRPGPAWAG